MAQFEKNEENTLWLRSEFQARLHSSHTSVKNVVPNVEGWVNEVAIIYLIESLFFFFFWHSFVAFWPDSSDYCHDMASHLRPRVHLLSTTFVNTFLKKKSKKQHRRTIP